MEYTLADLEERYGVDRTHLHQAIVQGHLPACYSDGAWRVHAMHVPAGVHLLLTISRSRPQLAR